MFRFSARSPEHHEFSPLPSKHSKFQPCELSKAVTFRSVPFLAGISNPGRDASALLRDSRRLILRLLSQSIERLLTSPELYAV